MPPALGETVMLATSLGWGKVSEGEELAEVERGVISSDVNGER